MTLVKWNSAALDSEINNLVRTFWGNPISAVPNYWNPRVDVSELEDRYEVTAELPGLVKEDVKVTLEDGILTLEGEKRCSEETEKDAFRRTERAYGKFSRSFNLGERVSADKISAAYKDGVLKVALPKTEEVKPKTIEIGVA